MKFGELLRRQGARESRTMALSIGSVATEELEPESADFIVEGGEGLAIFLDPEELQVLADKSGIDE